MIRSRLLLAIATSVLATVARAADFSSLLANSPFAPVGAGAAAAGDKSVEFRGSYTDPGKGATYFSIYDTATQRATWVGLNESGHPFVVRGYSQATDTVTVELSGHNLNLGLKHAQVQLVAAPKTPAPGGPPNGVPVADNQGRGRWMANMAGPDGRPDPQRMQAFIEEMRRRRGNRGGNANADNQGGPVPTNLPGPGPVPNTAPGPVPTPVPVDPNAQPQR